MTQSDPTRPVCGLCKQRHPRLSRNESCPPRLTQPDPTREALIAGADAIEDAIRYDARSSVSAETQRRRWDQAGAELRRLAALPTTPTPSLLAMMRALHETAVKNHNIGEGPARAICGDPSSHRRRAETMLAALAYTEPSEPSLDEWMVSVVLAWRENWEGKDHRYGKDFAAFLGERLMTDYSLRAREPYPFGHARVESTEPSEPSDENAVLLRRLDGWTDSSTDTGPLIRWAAAHLRGCTATEPSGPSLDAQRLASLVVSAFTELATEGERAQSAGWRYLTEAYAEARKHPVIASRLATEPSE